MSLPKSRRVLGLLVVLLISLPVVAVSAASGGQSCKKAGTLSSTKSGGKGIKLVCAKVGKKLVWVAKGTKSTGSCAMGGVCALGDVGPGGGLVFYNAGSTQSWGRYLEVAPSGWSGLADDPLTEWGCQGVSISGAAGTSVGASQANTTAIVTSCSTSGIAAQLADALTLGGQSDWFLPSKDALNLLFSYLQLRSQLGSRGFAAAYYWTSSDFAGDYAWYQYFGHGAQGNSNIKANYYAVRPVRAFG